MIYYEVLYFELSELILKTMCEIHEGVLRRTPILRSRFNLSNASLELFSRQHVRVNGNI